MHHTLRTLHPTDTTPYALRRQPPPYYLPRQRTASPAPNASPARVLSRAPATSVLRRRSQPDLLAASYVPAVRFQDVGLWMLLWWMPLTLFSVSGVILMWAIAYATSERCAGWTDSRCPCCFMCCIGLGWCPQRKARERADTDESDGAPLAGGTGQMQHRRRYPPATLERPHTAN